MHSRRTEVSDRVMRFAFFALIVLFAAYVAEPYVSRFFLAAETPRPVTARGDLADAERATVELFQRVSPSVVHVFAPPSGRDLMLMEGAGRGRAVGHRLHLGRRRPHRHQQSRRPGRAPGDDPARHRRDRLRARSSARRRTTISPCCASGAPASRRRRSPSAPPPTSRSARPPSRSAIRSGSTRP